MTRICPASCSTIAQRPPNETVSFGPVDGTGVAVITRAAAQVRANSMSRGLLVRILILLSPEGRHNSLRSTPVMPIERAGDLEAPARGEAQAEHREERTRSRARLGATGGKR